LPEAVQDALDRSGVATEGLVEKMAQEIQMLKTPKGEKHKFLPANVRHGTLHFMQNLVKLMHLDIQRWFESAVLLDVFDCASPGGIDIKFLPATAVAVVKLIWKTNNAVQSLQGFRLSQHASQLGTWLKSIGYPSPVGEVTEAMIIERESEILKALHWQVNLHSVETWMSTFCMRFNVLTHGLFVPSLDWVSRQSIYFARKLVFHRAAGQGLAPHRQAAGLFALSFVSAKLIPLDNLKPDRVSSADWEELFIKSQAQKTVPACVLQPSHSQSVQKLLQVATQMNLQALQEACYQVAEAIKDAMQWECGAALGTTANMEALGVAAGAAGIRGGHEVHHTTL
jgi:hypothetical protein